MNTINKRDNIKIYWKIFRGVNKITENFDNTNLRVFVVGTDNTYWLEPTINKSIEPNYEVLEMNISGGRLETGVYDIKAIWQKNGCRHTLMSARTGVFAITDNAPEATGENVIRLASYVESYGRDGMSAYEIAVMRNKVDDSVSEKDWIDNMVSGGIGDGSISGEKLSDGTVSKEKLDSTLQGKIELIDDLDNMQQSHAITIGEHTLQIENIQSKTNVDEEDLTRVSQTLDGKTCEVLKFKDRGSSDKGGGYVILRHNQPFVEQVTQENTIYEIRYNFDLGGFNGDGTAKNPVSIPTNCVLKFNGGSLRNGSIIGTDTRIIGNDGVLVNISQLTLPMYKVSWGVDVDLSNVDAHVIEVDKVLELEQKWQLKANQKVILLQGINIKTGGSIHMNIGCEINGNWNDITIKEADALHNIITIDGRILVGTYKDLYGDASFNSRTRVNIRNVNIRMDDSLSYKDAIDNNTAAAIYITASEGNWVWGANISNVTISGHLMAAVHVEPNGNSWIHDIYIDRLINDRTLYRLLIDSQDEEIKNTGVAVYDSNGSMQADNYSYVVWPYTPQRLVKMYTGIVMMTNVFPWDWHLTVDEKGNAVDGKGMLQDYIYEGLGGVLHIEDSYYVENEKNGLYNYKYNYITGTESFKEISTVKSNRVLTSSLTKTQENMLIERSVNNLSNKIVDWTGTLKYSKLSFRLPYGITYNTTVSYPRFIEIGYFKNYSTIDFCLALTADNSELLFDGLVSTYLNYKTKVATGFLRSLSWCYFQDEEGYHFGFILQDKNINLSAISFTIEKSMSFFFNLTSHSVNEVNLESINFQLKEQEKTRPDNPAIGDMYFDTELNKPIWAKTLRTSALLTLTLARANTKTGSIVININSKQCTLSVPQVCSTSNELATVVKQALIKNGFVIYTSANNFILFYVDGESPTFSIESDEIDSGASLGLNRAYVKAAWVDSTGTEV